MSYFRDGVSAWGSGQPGWEQETGGRRKAGLAGWHPDGYLVLCLLGTYKAQTEKHADGKEKEDPKKELSRGPPESIFLPEDTVFCLI